MMLPALSQAISQIVGFAGLHLQPEETKKRHEMIIAPREDPGSIGFSSRYRRQHQTKTQDHARHRSH